MYAHRTVTLSGPDGYGQRIPPERLGPLFQQITPAIRGSVRMRFLGRSASRGRRPTWLSEASDIRFVDYSGSGDTILHFEAPQFGEAVPELYEQGELWPTRPAPDTTGFDLLAEVVCDVDARNEDSEVFDRPLLRQIQRFDRVFDDHIQRLRLGALAVQTAREPVLTYGVAEAAGELWVATPPSRRVRVVGTLDMLWQSRQAFSLKLSGEPDEVRGSLLEGDIGELKELLGQPVLVEGKAVYRPSRRVLRVDAERVIPAGDIEGPWGSIPAPLDTQLGPTSWHVRQTPQTGINAIIGKWPSDETDEEIFAALESIS